MGLAFVKEYVNSVMWHFWQRTPFLLCKEWAVISVYWYIIFSGRKINRVEFSTCLNELKNETHNGFTEKEVEILIDALVSIKNLGKLFSCCTFSKICFEKKINFLGHWSFFNPLLTNIMWKMWSASLLLPGSLTILWDWKFLILQCYPGQGLEMIP
jgi:hypothetical protein